MKSGVLLSGLLALALAAAADERVALTATARSEYTQRKFEGGKARTETYVFMEGKFSGGLTADRSIEQMPFRRIAEFLAPELAKQQYLPTTDPKTADLLLVVHWGTTVPRVTNEEMRGIVMIDPTGGEDAASTGIAAGAMGGKVNPGEQAYLAGANETAQKMRLAELDRVTDKLSDRSRERETARALGYDRELTRIKNTAFSDEHEATMRSDLGSERYYIIIRAYDLKEKPAPGTNRAPVWTVYTNMRSPGQDFTKAVNLMGTAAKDYFGRDTLEMQTVRPGVRGGSVKLAPLVIEGDAPAEPRKGDDDKKPK